MQKRCCNISPQADKKEYCGLFGIYGHKDAAQLAYLGLYSLQHRGQESAGIVVSDEKEMRQFKGMGLVSDVFNDENLKSLKGHLAIGHVRYSTTGSTLLKNTQPFMVEYANDFLAVGHNGTLVNALPLRQELEKEGAIFQTTMDSEIIVHLVARSKKKKLQDRLIDALSRIKGAFSLVLITKDQVIGVRDPNGFRPLCLGQVDGSWVLSSETCALDLIQARYIREIEPGEVVFINKRGIHSVSPFPPARHAFCIFEYIYFARPDSNIFGHSVYLARKRLGERLFKEHPAAVDMIVPVPDSGTCAALGYAQSSGIPFEMGIIRNHYIGRTFILPSQHIRDFGVKVKLNPVKELLKGKRVAIIEDSIVRGTTSRARVKAIRDAGAKEVHMRISCPPLRHPCYYGIDFPTKEELIASQRTVDEIRDYIGLDSLGYLSLEGMLASMPLPKEEFCTCCFDGNYPVAVKHKPSRHSLEKG
ncbi:MAG: amidophosphoribosyltransferase [Candidatus Omnitrophica bacterium]|nr:amidophosphoribosyltransferase [Candidatus Omnitrophota bacterium]